MPSLIAAGREESRIVVDTHAVQTELFEVTELPGRPMLHWHGKRPLREIPYYPAQLRERYGTGCTG